VNSTKVRSFHHQNHVWFTESRPARTHGSFKRGSGSRVLNTTIGRRSISNVLPSPWKYKSVPVQAGAAVAGWIPLSSCIRKTPGQIGSASGHWFQARRSSWSTGLLCVHQIQMAWTTLVLVIALVYSIVRCTKLQRRTPVRLHRPGNLTEVLEPLRIAWKRMSREYIKPDFMVYTIYFPDDTGGNRRGRSPKTFLMPSSFGRGT